MPPRYVTRLTFTVTAADVGRRVSLRRRLPDGRYTDVVGVLEAWADGVLTVRRRDGSLAALPEDSLVAGKVVPSAPRRRSG